MANSNNGQFPANLPIVKGQNYDRWCAQMKVIFRFQVALEIVNDGVQDFGAAATEAHDRTLTPISDVMLIEKVI
jgi:hypothetical protein